MGATRLPPVREVRDGQRRVRKVLRGHGAGDAKGQDREEVEL